ncbi:MAG TPA: TetR/AcrR family transcriptional regulator [Novosphingobium sp.]|nr:TetR/AcrR family transcriptional regulator [Novosphingobium sp.]
MPAPKPESPMPANSRPTGRGRPSQKQSQAITAAILDAATTLFLKEGYDGTSMEAVANAVQIPKTTLYKRFPDKSELLKAVLTDRVASWSQVASQNNSRLTGDLRQRLTHYTTTMLLWTSKAEVRAFRKLALSASGRSSGALTDFLGYTGMVEFIASEIRAYGPASGIHARAPERIAGAIMAMVSGWVNTRGADTHVSAEDARAQAAFIIDVLTDGREAW